MTKRTKTKAQLEAENRVMLETLRRIVSYKVDNVPEECRENDAYPYAFGALQGDAAFTIQMIEGGFVL